MESHAYEEVTSMDTEGTEVLTALQVHPTCLLPAMQHDVVLPGDE